MNNKKLISGVAFVRDVFKREYIDPVNPLAAAPQFSVRSIPSGSGLGSVV
jgi:hypothetical protein